MHEQANSRSESDYTEDNREAEVCEHVLFTLHFLFCIILIDVPRSFKEQYSRGETLVRKQLLHRKRRANALRREISQTALLASLIELRSSRHQSGKARSERRFANWIR